MRIINNSLNRFLAAAFCAVLLTQCGSGNPIVCSDCMPGPEPVLVKPPRLISHSSCGELSVAFRRALLEEANATLDAYETCPFSFVADGGAASPNALPVSSPAGSSGADNAAEGAEFTSTNLQERGVDEADRIKTDGEYMYVAIPGGMDIFKAWPMAEFRKLASYSVDPAYSAEVPSIYLWEGKAVLISQSSLNTKITILDLSDPASPAKLDERELSGTYSASRLAGSVLHLVVSDLFLDSGRTHADLSRVYSDLQVQRSTICAQREDGSPEDLLKAVESARQEAEEAIETGLDSATWLPSHRGIGGQAVLAGCGEVFVDPAGPLSHMTGFLSVDLNAPDKPQVSFVSGYGYTVYASPQSVYLAASTGTQTNVHRFAIGAPGKLHQYTGTGGVLGTVLNSFSMGEKDNAFRIATTVGWNGSSSVTLLDNSKPELDPIGSLTGLAPGESIYAVRFIGDKGYVVTFKKVDPLFVIDLSNPSAPSVLGELKMPGYSTYLHPLDENRLLGLGKDADDQGSFAWFQGLKLALFNVADAANPLLSDEEIIGARGTESEALADHHAFTFDAESGMLALPLTYCSPTAGSGGSRLGRFEYQGVHLYSVSESSIDGAGVIELPDTAGVPLRTVLIGDEAERAVYILNEDKLYLADASNPGQIRAEAPLSRQAPGSGFWGASLCGSWPIWD